MCVLQLERMFSMFAFLKKKKDREIRKLIYQNLASEHYDEPLFKELCALNESCFQKYNLGENLKNVKDAKDYYQRVQIDATTESDLLRLNKLLRKEHDDSFAMSYLRNFDEDRIPLLGWDDYFDDFESEFHFKL